MRPWSSGVSLRLEAPQVCELWLCLVQVQVVHGQYRGINLKCIDTPGLAMSGSTLTRNAGVLHAIRKAMNKHKPDLVLYVDRNDVVGPVRWLCCRTT